MNSLNIGLVGFGTVGSGVYRILTENADLIKNRTGMSVKLKTICDLRIDEVKKVTQGVNVTNKWQDLIDDPEISVIVELIGGIEPAHTIIKETLISGKSVVTANKKLLAEKGEDLFALVAEGKGKLAFEAAVGGGIPCILSLQQGLMGDQIESIVGILNGTTNYILTKMAEHGYSFDDALKKAQDAGFAEADPTFDIEGFDAGHKISLLSTLAYNCDVDFKQIPITGITKISDVDIKYADSMGYVIKLLGISKMVDGECDIRVHPAMLPKHHPLAAIRNEFNAVMYVSDMTGPVTLCGKGAGSTPTASAVVSDVLLLALDANYRIVDNSGRTKFHSLPAEKRQSRFYIRLKTADQPGILSGVSGILAKHGISISSVIQQEGTDGSVPLLITTHSVFEGDMQNALAEISESKFVDGEAVLIRIEDSI